MTDTADRRRHDEPEMTPLGRIVDQIKASGRRQPDDDAVAAVDELFPPPEERLEYLVRFMALIVLSAAIAGFGLLADSAGVVIGAMLVAPLMTPILAAAAATVRADNRLLARSMVTIVLGTAGAVAIGYLVSVLAGDSVSATSQLPGELAGRTYPGLLDLGVAVSAGAAAGYIVPRRSAVSALPGVGIAVALVPPLATVGITWQLGRSTDAWNAMLLFLTNLAAIIFSASVMLLLAGFRPRVRQSRRRLATRLAVTLTAVVVVAVPLGVHTQIKLEDSRLNLVVAEVVEEWDPSAQVVDLNAKLDDGRASVELLMSGPNEPDQIWTLAEEIRDRTGRVVEMDVRYQQNARFQVTAR